MQEGFLLQPRDGIRFVGDFWEGRLQRMDFGGCGEFSGGGFSFYRKIWFAPGEIVLIHDIQKKPERAMHKQAYRATMHCHGAAVQCSSKH